MILRLLCAKKCYGSSVRFAGFCVPNVYRICEKLIKVTQNTKKEKRWKP